MSIDSIPAEIQAEVQRRLDEIERSERCRILFAIESGSRAWGFPSPDSDYDVRFVYVRPLDWYLSIQPGRDVIETPLQGLYDINGWDLAKALALLIKPNPVLLEWLCSPILYRADADAMAKLKSLGEASAHHRPSTHHYVHLAASQYRRFIEGREEVPLKKYFYALRPALALAWLRTRPDAPVPMNMAELRAGLDLDGEVAPFLNDLARRKAETRELGAGPRIPRLDRLIEDELAAAEHTLSAPPKAIAGELPAIANALFRELVKANDTRNHQGG